MSLTLYHVSWCPECELVRRKLTTLGLSYKDVVVPDVRPMRKQVHEVSGQYFVPVLTDGETVLTETHEILTYLSQRYGDGSEEDMTLGDGEDYPSCRI
jgi:glutathione S-transferase